MAADLHIHALTESCTEHDVARLRSGASRVDATCDAAYNAVAATPQFWVCEVSWLKAALFADSEQFVPSVAELVTEAIGRDFPVLDDTMIQRLTVAMFGNTPNATSYSTVDAEKLGAWMEWCSQNKGRKLFHVSW